jgi:hypothetical protein
MQEQFGIGQAMKSIEMFFCVDLGRVLRIRGELSRTVGVDDANCRFK